MVHTKTQAIQKSEPVSTQKTRLSTTHHRANPLGIGRLLIMVLTIALLGLGQGIWWWSGLVLLVLILLAVSRQGHVFGTAWSSCAMLLALTFWHQHIIPDWASIVILAAGMTQFGLSLLRNPQDSYRP